MRVSDEHVGSKRTSSISLNSRASSRMAATSAVAVRATAEGLSTHAVDKPPFRGASFCS